jgi:hypothetical protein
VFGPAGADSRALEQVIPPLFYRSFSGLRRSCDLHITDLSAGPAARFSLLRLPAETAGYEGAAYLGVRLKLGPTNPIRPSAVNKSVYRFAGCQRRTIRFAVSPVVCMRADLFRVSAGSLQSNKRKPSRAIRHTKNEKAEAKKGDDVPRDRGGSPLQLVSDICVFARPQASVPLADHAEGPKR